MKKMQANWKAFSAVALSSGITDAQRKEVKNIFYSGMHALLCTIIKGIKKEMLQKPEILTPQDLINENLAFHKLFTTLIDEDKDFYQALKKGAD